MIISMRTLKKQMKNNLERGTYVNSDTYVEIEKYMAHRLEEVINMTIREFKNTDDKKLKKQHAQRAIISLFYNGGKDESSTDF